MAKRKAADQQATPVASFEESLAELQTIVSELEEGSLGLETSLARFERGVSLLRACYAILGSAEQKVDILTRVDSAGQPVIVSFESAASFDQVDNGLDSAGDADSVEATVTPDSISEKPSLF